MDASGHLGLHPNTPGYVPLQNDGSPHPTGDPVQQPGYPPLQPGYPLQQPGYPPQQPSYPPQQPGNSPQHQTGYPGPPGFVNPVGYPNPGGDNAPDNNGKQPLMDNLPPNIGFVPPPGGVLFINGFDPVSVPPAAGYAPPPGPVPPGGPYAPMYGANLDMEAGEVKGFDFSDKTIRLAFIRKVYAILMTQLLVTFGFVAFCLLHQPTNYFFRRNPVIFHFAWLGTLVMVIFMACCNNLRRKAPYNYICLAVYTVAQSFMLGSFSSRFYSFEVLTAIGITAAICLSLTLFAFQTKYDFTMLGGVLLAFLIALIIFGCLCIVFPSKVTIMLYASLGAILFAFYLIYDTQVMMGGKHKYSTSPEEYIFAALNLYLDIVNIFMYILLIMSGSRK